MSTRGFRTLEWRKLTEHSVVGGDFLPRCMHALWTYGHPWRRVDLHLPGGLVGPLRGLLSRGVCRIYQSGVETHPTRVTNFETMDNEDDQNCRLHSNLAATPCQIFLQMADRAAKKWLRLVFVSRISIYMLRLT